MYNVQEVPIKGRDMSYFRIFFFFVLHACGSSRSHLGNMMPLEMESQQTNKRKYWDPAAHSHCITSLPPGFKRMSENAHHI